jgi:hypothetical protein
MIDLNTALFHHFFQVPIAERIGRIPAHTEQDDIFFYAVSFEVNHEAFWEMFVTRSLPEKSSSPN